ncbi:hypothetical protein GTY44_10480 [Streptomyces sp. SID5914]|nr:hypothetical protein [Streptomyces sp. SID5914]MZG13914.1 hypothetical protein [Streptomyces sp. SID5914]
MDELRFDEPIGSVAMGHRDNSLMILKALGTHSLRLQLEVKAPAATEAGRVLHLETDLYAPYGNGHRGWLGSSVITVPFRKGELTRPHMQYVLTSAQLRALEEHRSGDLRLEVEVRAVLPQATGYPGCPPAVLYIDVAESRWRQQLQGLGNTLAVEMSIPFPADDEPRQEATQYLLEAQRRLGNNDVDGAILEARRALERIRDISTWSWPGNKQARERLRDERWSWIRAALEDQASGAMHKDAITKAFTYTRAEAETMIAMVAALLRIVPVATQGD